LVIGYWLLVISYQLLVLLNRNRFSGANRFAGHATDAIGHVGNDGRNLFVGIIYQSQHLYRTAVNTFTARIAFTSFFNYIDYIHLQSPQKIVGQNAVLSGQDSALTYDFNLWWSAQQAKSPQKKVGGGCQ
jgi:hypothetical protein